MLNHLPHEVFLEILLRLPLKTLFQCTSVCKSWSSTITNPSFITTHLNRSTASNTNSNTDLLLLRQFSKNQEKERYSLRLDNETLDECAELELPFKTLSEYYFRIVGASNGLLCLSDDLLGYRHLLILWNPSIRKFVTLPRPRITFMTHGPYSAALGFGFDVKSNDYKVVRVVNLRGDDIVPAEVELYPLSSGSWRGITSPGPRYIIPGLLWSQAFMNGAVHWVAYEHRKVATNTNEHREVATNTILTFHMGDEVFGEMMLPTSLVHVFGVSIAVYGESLALLHFDVHLFDSCCCIWMMKEYGVVESWTKQFRIDIQAELVNTVGLRKNAEILLAINDGDLVSYHPKTQRIKDLGIHGDSLHVSNSLYVGTYVESLVLLKGVNGVLGGLEESSDAVPCTSLLGGNDEVEKTATVEGNED